MYAWARVWNSCCALKHRYHHFLFKKKRSVFMTNEALFVRLESKPGKEKEVEQFLRNGLQLVNREHDTISWYALRLGPSTFGIFDTFADEKGRQAHLNGEVAKALMQRSAELFSKQPSIEKADILVAKMPEMEHMN